MSYIDFASKISFYEFVQDEFKEPHFKLNDYADEIELLKGKLTIEGLCKIFETNPKAIDIFEEIFQLSRFTNAQYINFCFDVNVLNNSEDELILSYIKNGVFTFENGKANQSFLKFYNKYKNPQEGNTREIIFNSKRAIIDYIDKSLTNRTIFYEHLKQSIGTRLRVAKYLIENLNASEYISSINISNFLKLKRQPKDTKGLHGNFGIKKITQILLQNDINDIANLIKDKTIKMGMPLLKEDFKNKFCFIREKSIEGILKRKDGKLKKFDFIILYNREPVVLVETNFYTTTGTKIGINEGEYTDLLEDVKIYQQKNKINLKFIWITDGNYWLTGEGEDRYNNLKSKFFTGNYELLNYNLFRVHLPSIKNAIRQNKFN